MNGRAQKQREQIFGQQEDLQGKNHVEQERRIRDADDAVSEQQRMQRFAFGVLGFRRPLRAVFHGAHQRLGGSRKRPAAHQ